MIKNSGLRRESGSVFKKTAAVIPERERIELIAASRFGDQMREIIKIVEFKKNSAFAGTLLHVIAGLWRAICGIWSVLLIRHISKTPPLQPAMVVASVAGENKFSVLSVSDAL